MLMVADLQSSLSSLTVLQQQTATGKVINQPSDNPTGTSEVLALNSQLGRFQQYATNITDGQSWLNTADSTLGSVTKALTQVQTAVLSGSNSSSNDPATDQALSQQVLTIKSQLLGLSSASYDGKYIFSGNYGTSPYPQGSASGISDPTSATYNSAQAYAYAGSATPISRVVSPGQSVNVSLTGSQVFGSGSTSVFALLDTVSQDLASGNSTGLSTDLTQLQSAMSTVTQAQGESGALGASLTSDSTQVANTVTALQDRVGNITDANEATVASELDLAEVTYQAALETTAKTIQPSLVQFLS